jgi:hypothetical protein
MVMNIFVLLILAKSHFLYDLYTSSYDKRVRIQNPNTKIDILFSQPPHQTSPDTTSNLSPDTT